MIKAILSTTAAISLKLISRSPVQVLYPRVIPAHGLRARTDVDRGMGVKVDGPVLAKPVGPHRVINMSEASRRAFRVSLQSPGELDPASVGGGEVPLPGPVGQGSEVERLEQHGNIWDQSRPE